MNAIVMVAVILVAAMPLAAAAQRTNQSDVTGVATTGSTIAGGAFTPGPGQVAVAATPQVQAAIGQATAAVTTQLTSGDLRSPSGAAIPATAQAAVLSILTDAGAGNVAAALTSEFTAAGAPAVEVAALVESVSGLLSAPAPGQLAAAIGNWNSVVEAAPASFLQNPPATFTAVQAVLSTLVNAANAAG